MVYTSWILAVLPLPSDELTFIGVMYNSHFCFMLSCTSKPEKIQWSWDENYSQKTVEDKVLEKTDNSTGRKNGLSEEHYKELYLKKKPTTTAPNSAPRPPLW